jgi:hypothetical protein
MNHTHGLSALALMNIRCSLSLSIRLIQFKIALNHGILHVLNDVVSDVRFTGW